MKLQFVISFLMLAIVLPREAVPEQSGKYSGGWNQTGEIALPFAFSCRRFETELDRAGWQVKDHFLLEPRKKVSVWTKDKQTISLMIWEKELTKSGFSWGELTGTAKEGGGDGRNIGQ